MKYGIHSLVFKQSLVILLGISVVFGVLFGILSENVGKRISNLLMERGNEISEKNVAIINGIFSDAELVGENILVQLSKDKPDAEKFPQRLAELLEAARKKVPETVALVLVTNPEVYGEYMKVARFKDDKIEVLDGKNYSDKDWYKKVKEAGVPIWQEPFIGDVVTEPIAIYSIPYFMTDKKGQKVFAGVICVDISLEFLQQAVSSVQVENSGYAFMLSGENTIVAHPKKDWIYKESLRSLIEKGATDLSHIATAIREKKNGLIQLKLLDGSQACVYYTRMHVKGWTFGVVWPADAFFERQRETRRIMIIALVGCYVFMLLIVLLVSFHVALPLNKMSRVAHDLGRGNFNVQIPTFPGKDEVAQFARAFTKMHESLVEYIVSLQNMTDKNMRLESELNIARDIQLGVLPKDEDEESMRDVRHELEAFLQPAREVGGDFYDFYALDKDNIVFTIADVSGKGVPAALFMMSVRTQLKSLALAGIPLDSVFEKANERLAHKNDSNMFVTVWMGVLNLTTGEVRYCNAGHNPPVIRHADGSAAFLKGHTGLVMAGMSDMKYTQQTMRMQPGDTLFLYTDGVTEAIDEKEELFGEKRLVDTLFASKNVETKDLCGFVKKRLDEFVGNAPQFDDITMLALKYKGSPKG